MIKENTLSQLAARAHQLDAEDPLSFAKVLFMESDSDELYMDGNSLGRLPNATREHLMNAIDYQWGTRLIRSWNEYWYDSPTHIGEKLGTLIGANPGEVVISDSTTVNLFKLLVSALKLRPDRKRIISDVLNFPTDLYTIQGAIRLMGKGHELVLLPSQDEITVSLEDYAQALNEDTAVVTFSAPTFKSGFLYNIQKLTEMAHEVGALVIWDFSHAIGVVPISVTEWQIDFAVGCTYKYLNGGPGSPAFMHIRKDHLEKIENQPLGWWGHKSPFSFDLNYSPSSSIRKALVGTPPVLSMIGIEPALDIIQKAGIQNIRAKSILLCEFFIEAFDLILAERGYSLGSPRESSQRGSHVSIRHPESYRIYQALTKELKVIPDFREPDNIRLGFSPLYTSFSNVYELVVRLVRVIDEQVYAKYDIKRAKVT